MASGPQLPAISGSPPWACKPWVSTSGLPPLACHLRLAASGGGKPEVAGWRWQPKLCLTTSALPPPACHFRLVAFGLPPPPCHSCLPPLACYLCLATFALPPLPCHLWPDTLGLPPLPRPLCLATYGLPPPAYCPLPLQSIMCLRRLFWQHTAITPKCWQIYFFINCALPLYPPCAPATVLPPSTDC